MTAIHKMQVSADEADIRLDRWFKLHFPSLSFSHLQKLLRSGQIRVDGARAKNSTRLLVGQTVRVPPLDIEKQAHTDASSHPPASHQSARDFLKSLVLYEDTYVMALNKPYGLAVQGGSGISRHIDGMLDGLRDKKGQRPRLVHRLDRDTSGVLLVAKTRMAAHIMTSSFRLRDTQKIYWALVKGVPSPTEGRISSYILKESTADGDRMRIVPHGAPGAQHALTHYRVVERAGKLLSWLIVQPVTGRTHQLRIQLQSLGTPIIGDPKYFDDPDWVLPKGLQNRLHLHARQIVIPHPVPKDASASHLCITAPLPPHMYQSFRVLNFDDTINAEAV